MLDSESMSYKLKKEIIIDVMRSILNPINRNVENLKSNEILDLLFSVLIMTNRDVLVRMITFTNSQVHTKKILKSLFAAVEAEVRKELEVNYKDVH